MFLRNEFGVNNDEKTKSGKYHTKNTQQYQRIWSFLFLWLSLSGPLFMMARILPLGRAFYSDDDGGGCCCWYCSSRVTTALYLSIHNKNTYIHRITSQKSLYRTSYASIAHSRHQYTNIVYHIVEISIRHSRPRHNLFEFPALCAE